MSWCKINISKPGPRLCLLTGNGIVEHFSFGEGEDEKSGYTCVPKSPRKETLFRGQVAAFVCKCSVRVAETRRRLYGASEQASKELAFRAFEVARVQELLQGKKYAAFFPFICPALSWTLREHSLMDLTVRDLKTF